MDKQTFTIPENCKTVTVEQVDNQIIATFEKECIPKDGDFIATKFDTRGCIFIYKSENEEESDNADTYCGLDNKKCISYDDSFGLYSMGTEFSLATEPEKQQLLDALAKDGKRWDAENKKVVKLSWRAEKGCWYQAIKLLDSGRATIETYKEAESEWDNARYSRGNYYDDNDNTALEVADRINAIFAGNL